MGHPSHPEFSVDADIIYLNHAAVAPWPRRTSQAVCQFAEENSARGASGYAKWRQTEESLRTRLRWLINAESPDDIALLKSTSEGLSIIAHGLDWTEGDNVVIPDEEFPSNRIVWESLSDYGVEVRQAHIQGVDSPEQALIDLVDERTRLISVSAVQYATGLRMDPATLGRFCRRNGILFCVDAIQLVGALPFDAQAVHADFVVADAHKWMLGPEGVALFYCRPDLRERISLHQFGWHMVEHSGEFERRTWAPASSARRFECGSPNMLGIHALDASLSLFQDLGMEAISTQLLDNTALLCEQIQSSAQLTLRSSAEPGRYAGIVTFAHKQLSADQLHRRLTDAGVICAQRGGGVRFSPHFYNTTSQLEKAVAIAAYAD